MQIAEGSHVEHRHASSTAYQKQPTPLETRLDDEAQRLRERAAQLPPAPERDDLIRKVRETETTIDMVNWINSPGLQPPSWCRP